MGTVHQFTGHLVRLTPRQLREKARRYPEHRLVDLHGERPRGHISAQRDTRGKIVFNVDNVCVDKQTDELWWICEITRNPKGIVIIHLARYSRYKVLKSLRVQVFRTRFEVWEDAINSRKA